MTVPPGAEPAAEDPVFTWLIYDIFVAQGSFEAGKCLLHQCAVDPPALKPDHEAFAVGFAAKPYVAGQADLAQNFAPRCFARASARCRGRLFLSSAHDRFQCCPFRFSTARLHLQCFAQRRCGPCPKRRGQPQTIAFLQPFGMAKKIAQFFKDQRKGPDLGPLGFAGRMK